MKFFSILNRIFRDSAYSFYFSLGLYLLSLLSNTSFRVMGFDLSSQLETVLNPDFGIVLLVTHFKIFSLYYLFFSTVQLLLTELYESFSITPKRFFPYFITITISIWIYSIVKHPQLYSDFFYGRHTYLQFFLYICTDFLPIFLFPYSVALFWLGLFSYQIIMSIRKLESRYVVTILYLLFTLIFHWHGNFWGLFLSYIIWKIAYFENQKIRRLMLVPSFLGIVIFFSLYVYVFYLFAFPKKGIQHPSILLISADSLRKDMIGKIVNGKNLTPNLNEFAKQAVDFTDHHVTIPRTFPSWADLLTGEFSMRHKIRGMFPSPEEIKNLGSEKFPTIGHYLKTKGFHSAVFSNFAGDIFPRADFGFEEVNAPTFNAKVLLVQKSLESQIFLLPVLSGAIGGGGEYFPEIHSFAGLGDGEFILNKLFPYLHLHRNESFFATAFFSVTHFPYSPPYPFYKEFGNKDYYGPYKYFKFVDPTSNAKPSLEDIEQIRSVFYASVNSFDSDFGKLMQFLKKENLYDNMVIILTGDHGENLYEDIHGQGHGEHLRGEFITHVPLFIKLPENLKTTNLNGCNSNCQFQGITSSVDILPTILGLYGIDPQKELPGRNLFPLPENFQWKDDRAVYAETGIWFSDIGDHFFQKQRIMYPNILQMHRVVPEENYQIMITDPFYRNTIAFAKHRALLTNQYKFIYIPTHDGVIYELYDRKIDPENTKNLFPNQNAQHLKTELIQISNKWENSKIISDYIFPEKIE